MAMVLPPLTAVIDQGAAGGHEFERLMHQFLLQEGKARGYAYEPVSEAGGDGGINGWIAQGLPELKGAVAFQFKWLWDDLHKGSKAAQIKDSLQRAASHSRRATHWVEESRACSGTGLLRIVARAVHGERMPAGVSASHGYNLAAVYPREEGGVWLRVWPRVWSEKNKDFRADVHNLLATPT